MSTKKHNSTPDGYSTLFVFVQDGCRPCESLKKIMKSVSFPDNITTITIDCDEYPEVADYYRIKETPTLLGFRHGRYTCQAHGAMSKTNLKKFLRDLSS